MIPRRPKKINYPHILLKTYLHERIERTNTRRAKVLQSGAAKPPSADDHNGRGAQFELSFAYYYGKVSEQ